MAVATTVIAYIIMVCTVMTTPIRSIMMRFSEIEVVMVGRMNIYSKLPSVTCYIDRAIEVFNTHKSAILTGT